MDIYLDTYVTQQQLSPQHSRLRHAWEHFSFDPGFYANEKDSLMLVHSDRGTDPTIPTAVAVLHLKLQYKLDKTNISYQVNTFGFLGLKSLSQLLNSGVVV